ncbi:class I SAM-dependent methyltransferase [Phenylobacterium sp. J367]|uniref:class I SAM-dependent methyltransferase n=1 Tax=Phenylobacterium sp. J367 TaxID=2898435 RepID=UPI002151B633|nr:class I SAM-dependent methyltransferase [Phenylobacterium sp. J367]MCR5879500.1 class I SAM-dependent methyltransferase [Phenylobacterium sp. J367]
MLRENHIVRLLEIGAGKSHLPAYLRRYFGPDRLHITLHDINDRNTSHNSGLGVEHINCKVEEIPERLRFDIIVSFFVFEHIIRPFDYIRQMDNILNPAGLFLFVCPRYDIPGYIPPAVRHLSLVSQLAINARLVASAALAHLTRKPRFWVTSDPAVLNRSWRRDCDAVHLVSGSDLHVALGERGYQRAHYRVRLGKGLGSNILRIILLRELYRKSVSGVG